MSTIIQRAFSGGEISPSLHVRVDTAKYQTGLATLRNFQVQRYGGATNRAGTQFVGEVKDSSKTVRLIPFIFNASQTYVLEFGDLYMRVIKNGAYIKETAKSVTAGTNASPAVFTSTAHGYSIGDEISMNGGFGFVNRNFTVDTVPTADTFTLRYKDNGFIVDGTPLGAFTTTTAARIYTITTPYTSAQLPYIQYVQSADVVTLTHQSHAPRKLSRTGDTIWGLTVYSFAPTVNPPLHTGSTAGAAGSNIYKYRATEVNEDGEESILSTFINLRANAITKANPAVVTAANKMGVTTAHGLTTGDVITFDTVLGMTEISGKTYTITVVDANRFSLNGVDSTGYGTFTSGSWSRYYERIVSAVPTTTAPNTLNFFVSLGASKSPIKRVNVYREDSGVYGYLGTSDVDSSGNAVFKDYGLATNNADRAPEARDPFANGSYPAAVSYIQQRLAFANTPLEPEKVWLSRTGAFTNFTTSSPMTDDQAITFTMAGKQVNAVRYLLDIGQFVVMTSGGEWAVLGENGVITPTGINPKQSSYNGSAEGLQPIIIDNTALYTQARGSIIRDLAYNYQSDGYTGNDLTLFSSHLFDKFTLKDWAYQQVPQSILWVVRDDGTLLGLTYVKDQQILAWHRHDTDGVFENVCSVPEGNEDVLYVVVRRTVSSNTVRYIERFATRKVLDIRDSKFMDSCISYDGRNTNVNFTMTLTGSGWTFEDALTLTASQAAFVSSDIDNGVFITGADGTVLRVRITGYTSPTVVTVMPERTVPVSMQGFAFSTWSKAVKSLKGLQHLNSKAVVVFADGGVVSSPNNPDYDSLTVSGGQITFDKPYAVVHIGLPYISDLETLNIDSAQNETLLDKEKLVNQVTIAVEETRGGFIGGQKPPTAFPTLNLVEFKPRSDENYDSQAKLVTGRLKQTIAGSWNSNGKVFLRQVDPLPMSVLAIAPRMMRG